MSGTVLKEFLVRLGFDIDKAQSNAFQMGLTGATAKAVALGAATAAAAGGVVAWATAVANTLDDLADLGQRTNTAASEIDRLNYIAELTDSSTGAVAMSLEAVAKNAGDAAMGVGRAKQIFEKMGISVKDANGNLKGAVPLMQEIGERIQGMDIGQQNAVLERIGIDRTMLKMLTEDVSGLSDEYAKMMEAAGINMDDAASASGDYVDSLNKLRLTFTRLQQAVAVKFMRGIAKSFESFRKLMIDNMPMIISVVTPVIDIIMRVANVFLFLANTVMQGVGFILGGLMKLNSAFGGLPAYILAAVVAWKTLNLAFLASPIGIILSLAAAVALLYDDFQVWQEGGQSLIPWEKWQSEIDSAKAMLQSFRDWLEPFFDFIFSGFDKLQNLGSFIGQNLPVFTPSAPAQAAGSGGATVNQQTTVNVNGGANPEATARAVAGEQGRVNDDLARNTRGAVR